MEIYIYIAERRIQYLKLVRDDCCLDRGLRSPINNVGDPFFFFQETEFHIIFPLLIFPFIIIIIRLLFLIRRYKRIR